VPPLVRTDGSRRVDEVPEGVRTSLRQSPPHQDVPVGEASARVGPAAIAPAAARNVSGVVYSKMFDRLKASNRPKAGNAVSTIPS